LVVTDGVVVVAVETLLLELALTAAFSGRNRRRFRLAISRPPLPRRDCVLQNAKTQSRAISSGLAALFTNC
jgi:hypothetical protein